jgi:hypothetical protein
LRLPEGLAEQVKQEQNGPPPPRGDRQDKELERLNSQLEAATRATFGVLTVAKERTDMPLILQCVDRILAIAELKARVVGMVDRGGDALASENGDKS